MHARHLLVTLAWALASPAFARAEPAAPPVSWSIGTSAWMLANALPDPPQFYYLEIDRRLGAHDELVVEAATWTYDGPIGIPYGSSFGDDAHDYPGFVRSIGLGVGWRRYLHRGANVSARALHFLQLYHEDGQPRTTGYQLFLQARAGWRWTPARTRGLWVEPSIACNWWPIEVGRPDSFEAMDDEWPSYFLLEPWLNAGWSW